MLTLDLPTWLYSSLLFPFGLIFGSFGNVLIHRLPREEEVVIKRSHCPSCGAMITAWQNIPILSWVILLGKCSKCGWRIPVRYPLVELLSGLLFGLSPWIFPLGTIIWFKALLAGYALIILFFTDWTEFILPDLIQLPLILVGLLLTLPQLVLPAKFILLPQGNQLLAADLWHNGLQPSVWWSRLGTPVDWLDSLLGILIGYGLPAILNQIYKWIRKTDGFGMGDFKMLAWLGAFWGWGPMLGILFGAAFLGTLVGVPLMLIRPEGSKTMLPFGCFLALVTPIMVFWGPDLWQGYLHWIR